MTRATTRPLSDAKSARVLGVGLWLVQGLLFLVFVGTGLWKLLTPVSDLAAKFPWMGQVPVVFMRATGVVDLLGGLGVLLPALTRVKPGLTVWAAFGCAVLQLFAIIFHFSRGEAANTPFNFFLVGLSIFVFWGRRSRLPISPRS